jgi:ribosomal protein S18 acetylase RimI-like enzyme
MPRTLACLCGSKIEAPDADALSKAYWAHTAEAHGDLKVSQQRLDDAEAAIRRTGGWDGVAAPPAEIEIRPLTAAAKDDYLRFFDQDAFPDNPAWASCYCISYHVDMPPEQFDERGAAANRADRAAMIERGDASGVMAYATGAGGGRVVGWVNASPRTSYPLLDKIPEFAADDPATSGAIVCFVINPSYRGQGLARKLLDGACDMLRARGLKTVYAYPPPQASTAAGSYHGKLSMYLDAGFQETGAATKRYVVVKKSLS